MAISRGMLMVLAMLCLAGPQAALILALLGLALRRSRETPKAASSMLLEAAPNGIFRLQHNGAQSNSVQTNAVRRLEAFWQGPFWVTVALRDPYFPHTPPEIVTLWSFDQAPDDWRLFRVLVQSALWVDDDVGMGRIAV